MTKTKVTIVISRIRIERVNKMIRKMNIKQILIIKIINSIGDKKNLFLIIKIFLMR